VDEGVLSYERCEAEFAAETARLGAAVTTLAPDSMVPTCPEWTVRDLVGHVGTGHRWSAGIVAGRLAAPPPLVRVDPPANRDAWPGWLRDGADRLAAAVRAAGSDAPLWTWRAPRNAGFWLRKMLHDEVVHRADVELAAGMPCDVAADVAIDGISSTPSPPCRSRTPRTRCSPASPLSVRPCTCMPRTGSPRASGW
jgi:uncharacterized protein (TIGR03083 family)